MRKNQTPPVIGRIVDDKFILDVRTINEKDFQIIKDAVEHIQ